mmetsp:Transcript_76654/g.94104  ORF Transcript_76654/g.94104 Transcript_76654/m.94104 type:complete len:121 (+) Transcript_76654:2-364(+)
MPRAISYCMDALLNKSNDIIKPFNNINNQNIHEFIHLIKTYEDDIIKRYNKKILNEWKKGSELVKKHLKEMNELHRLLKKNSELKAKWKTRWLENFDSCNDIIKKVKNYHKQYWKCFQDI